MSTTAAIYHFNTQNAISQAEAREAKTLACKGVVDTFDSKTATIEQSQDYARCINHLYPAQLEGAEALMLKVAIVLCFMCAIYGAMHFGKKEGDWFSALMGFLIGFCFAVVVSMVFAGCVLAAIYLFT